MIKVLVPLANGFEDIEAVTIVDVLRRGGVTVVAASIHDTPDVAGAHGLRARADAVLSEVAGEDFDAIVIPGGSVGTENLKNCDAFVRMIIRQRERGGLLCAICAGPTVLQEAGLISPMHYATCYPTCQMELNCNWVNEPVVEHDRIITGQAPGSAMIFSLVVLKALKGEAVAKKVARGMVFDF
ncbi:MAG: DJ-1/PfpI family protein [Kiritimatiellae bacterium]|nr:DJ-1/PfpI family protein [Kiritimatiellia bacterium]